MVKNPLADAGDAVRSLGREDPLEEDNSNPLQYSCLENPIDRGAWWATDHGVAKESDTTEQLNNNQLPCDSPVIFLQIDIPLKPGKGVQYSGSLLWGTDNCRGKLVF